MIERRGLVIVAQHTFIFGWVASFMVYILDRFSDVAGYGLIGYGFSNFFLALPYVVVLALFLKSAVTSVSDLIVLFAIILYANPLLFLLSTKLYLMTGVFLVFLLFLFMYRLIGDFRVFNWITPPGSGETKFAVSILVAMATFIVAVFMAVFPPKLSISLESSLYSIRHSFKDNYSGLSVYVFTLTQYFAVPVFIYKALAARRIGFFLFWAALPLWFVFQVFAYSALKSSIFLLVFLFALRLFVGQKGAVRLSSFLTAFAWAGGVVLVMAILSPDITAYFLDHSLRRMIIGPSLNGFYYLDYLVDSGAVFEYGVPSLGNVVSSTYYLTGGNATTGMLCDLLGRFGLVGVVIFVFGMPLYLKFLAHLLEKVRLRDQCLLFGGYSYVLLNTSLLTAQLTYGLFLMLFPFVVSALQFKARRC